MALTKDQIWAVADRLEAEGKAPTLAAVRKALGSGSFTTISEAMREWHQRRKEKADKVQEAGPMPPDLDDAVRRFAHEVWAKASEVSKAELVKAMAAFDEARKEWERERLELEAIADDLSSALEDAQARMDEALAAHKDLAMRYTEAQTKILALEEQQRFNETRLADLQAANEKLHALLEHAMRQKGEKDALQ
jgi:chromosome segregation ATPase